MFTQAIEDYLKTIYNLQSRGLVTTTEIAREMNVSLASVTSMLKRLAQLNMITYISYKGVALTVDGEKKAVEILRNHRLIELYLSKKLGYDWDEVDEEADRLEHHISDKFREKISDLLDTAEFNPHGEPIPTEDGFVPAVSDFPLSDAQPGQVVKVKRVSDKNSDILKWLSEIGLKLESKIKIVSREPFEGPMVVAINGEKRHLWEKVSESVFVEELENGR